VTAGFPTAPVRVFIADDHPLTLDGIKAAISRDSGMEIVGEAADGPTALRRAITLKPDVAVLDFTMPGLSGLDLAQKLLNSCPECRILVLSTREDVADLRNLLDLGVAGCVLKSSASSGLSRCVRAVANGGVYLDPAIAGQIIRRPQAGAVNGEGEVARLSSREVEVLRLAALGHGNKTISTRLKIGPKSVETYKARAMAKLELHGRVDLVRFAMSKGWFEDSAGE
jgi:DNA-binding NarL/FixJ family response regulator